MFCEAYNQSLTDAAASGEQLSPALQQHLASCDSCRAAFADEQSLFAAIDSDLRTAANAEIPPSLAVRVRAALDAEHARRLLTPKWTYSSAILGGVLLAAAVLALRSQHSVPSPQLANIRSSGTPPSEVPPPPVVPTVSSYRAPRRNPPANKEISSASPGSTPLSAEVLVPEEERAAFAQFMGRVSPSPMGISAGSALVPRAPRESVELSPVEIASLKLEPLEPNDAGQAEF